jgi:predicted nucleotidyltransferase
MTVAAGVELPEDAIAEVCRRYQVSELSLFGSAARGDMRSDSDVDLLVGGPAGPRWDRRERRLHPNSLR